MAEILHLRNLGVEINNHHLLRGVSISISEGECVAVIGSNGAGKSTLLRAAHGLIPPTTGAVEIAPQVLRGKQAMIFQRPVMLRRSVLAHTQFALGTDEKHAEKILDAEGLAHLGGQPARALSGGEQQRLALALAAARDPYLLFADEPTASLDLTAIPEVEARLRTLHQGGTAIVIATHSLGQVKRLATRVLFLHRGELTDDIPAARFFSAALSSPAQSFLEGQKI